MTRDPTIDVILHRSHAAALKEREHYGPISCPKSNDPFQEEARRLHTAHIEAIGLTPKLVQKFGRHGYM